MAGFQKIYTSQNQYLEDVARSTGLFDDEYYGIAKETGKDTEYLQLIANMKDNVSSTFDRAFYDKLSGEERFNYLATENFMDKSSQEYVNSAKYFKQREQEIKNEEIYNSLTGFQKTLYTVGGWFGSLGLGVYGLGEGLINAAALIGGGIAGIFDNQNWEDAKDFIAKDTTGYNAAQKALSEFRQTYTFENKQQWMGAINDVFGAIGQMAPMLVTGGASAVVKGIGTAAYYVGMAGNTAEQAVVNNPDIDYWKLLVYTGAVTGVEALTEWVSGKMFGEGVIGWSGFNPKQISGSMFKTILHSMGTEAAEEAVSELFGGVLEYYLVTEDKESLPTIEKVLYAALIGGITGGVLAGGRIVLTPRMSVTSEGQVKYNKDLTTEERESAKKLGLRKSWAVQSLLQQSSDALNRVDEVTKLQTKYSTLSLDQIKTQHADEYQKAVDADIEIKTKQAKSFLSLAKLMHEIGETNFKEAVDLLNSAVEDAERMVDNYINHRAEGNKKASEIFSDNFPNRSFTPSTIPSKTNQMLAEAIRKAFPNLNVVFGTFGDKDGDPARAINGTETYLFIDENFAAKHGTQALVEAVRYQLADQLMSELEIFDKAGVDELVRLFTDTDVPYSKLSKEQKRTIAQILCFDAVNARKLFRNSSKTHRKIFKYFTDQSEYVKKFGRQTEANKIRYHDLLSIRNMYIQNIVDTIGNMEDVRAIAEEYGITEDELKTKIIDKMITTNANDKVKLTKLRQVKEACQKRDAFNELYQSRIDTTEDFDFSRMYDPEYYSEDFVNTVSQGNTDFKQALNEYILRQHGIVFVDKTEFDVVCESMISSEMVEEFSKEFLTKEYLDTNPSFADKKATVIDALYMFSQVGTDSHGDSVIVTDTKIEGTGQLHFILGENINGKNLLSQEQRGQIGKSSGNIINRMAPDSAKYTYSKFSNVEVDVQDDSTIDDHQKALAEDCKNKYGLTLHFYRGDVNYNGKIITAYGFVDGNDVYLRYDGTLTNQEINTVIEHEATHRRIDAESEKYKETRAAIRRALSSEEYHKWYSYYENLYGEIYDGNEELIEEEMMVDIFVGAIKPTYIPSQQAIVKPWVNGFKKTSTKLIKQKVESGVKFSVKETTTKKQPHITDKDIEKLASTDYRSGKKDFSQSKGYKGREHEVASVNDYESKHGDLISNKIRTLDDLKKVLDAIKSGKIGSPERGFVLDLIQLTVLPFNFKGTRYQKAKALFDEVQSTRTTNIAEEMKSRSELFAQTNPMKALADELSEKHGAEIKPSEKMMIKWVPMYADRTNWLNRIQEEHNQLVDKRKHTEDPYTREQINDELKYLRALASAVAEDDTATILDLTIQKLQKSDENKIQNETTIQEMTRDFVADLIQHTDTSGPVKYNPNKKYILKPEHAEKIVDFWKKVNAFRYLAMLSSPATWGRNALTNTLVCVNALVEDVIGGKIEQSRLLRQESQANFTGDYNKDFGDAVEEHYKSRIDKDTAGDKYHTNEINAIRQKWAEENDPMKKNKLLGKIKSIEQKMLNDKPWTTRRVMRNLKNMLAGSMNMISKSAYAELKAMYKGETAEEIYSNMLEKGSPLAEEFKKVYITDQGADMVGVLNLAAKLSSTSVILDQIYEKALYRGNKLLFKTDNVLSKAIGKLQDKHPMTAAFVTAAIPFARTSFNTTAYIVNHSPIGLLKGIIQAFQTRNMYYGDMRQAITDYHKREYVKQHKEANKDFQFNEAEFKQWCDKNLSGDVVSAINGDYKSIKSVFDQYVELGRVSQSLVGASDIFARATTIESIAQGTTGTGLMVLGILLATMIDGFKIDEDDYLGPVLQIGDLRIKLDDLSPFSTLFSVGAVINSGDGFLDGFEKFAGILIDASMLNVVESAIQYSDSIPDYLGNQQINFIQQFVPAIFKSFTKVIDNGKKNKSGNFYQKLIKTTVSNLPFFSYLVADKINPYTGEKEKIYQSGFLESLLNQMSPIGLRMEVMSDFEREARRIGAETTGLSGSFKVNDIDYDVKNKEKYSKYKAEYINEQYYLITSGKQKVTVEDDEGKRITTTYNKLTDKQKKNVINRLYTDATSMTKIKWWTDQGNTYVVTDRDLYSEYRKMFSNIIYKKNWSKSKFVES
jgi:hypothetical protein